MGNPRCSWVRNRLPLLAGDELWGLDRRRVERHLIGCPKCREHHLALEKALEALQSARAESPARLDAPSLWPGLARQIRESHRATPTASFSWPRFAPRPTLALGTLGLGLLVAAGIAVGARLQIADSTNRMRADARPIAEPAVATVEAVETPPAVDPRHEPVKAPNNETPVVENTPAPRLNYDLDHAIPMGSDGRDGKQPTY